jgi:hypothetical protein
VVRVNEPSGTFDTELLLEDYDKVYEIPYHTKHLSLRKPKKKRKTIANEDEDQGEDTQEIFDEEEEDDSERYSKGKIMVKGLGSV